MELNEMKEEFYLAYLDALLIGDHRTCRSAVRELLDQNISMHELYVHLFQRSLYAVGELWERNEISVATEHLATAVTERVMAEAYPKLFSQDYSGHKALVACPADEFHQIGAQMVADVFELNGWHGYFLGASTPMRDLLTMIEDKQPEMLALSISVSFNFSIMAKAIREIRIQYSELPILVGGQAFRWGGQEVLDAFDHVQYLASLYDLEQMIQAS